jgi:hypothetical protein
MNVLSALLAVCHLQRESKAVLFSRDFLARTQESIIGRVSRSRSSQSSSRWSMINETRFEPRKKIFSPHKHAQPDAKAYGRRVGQASRQTDRQIGRRTHARIAHTHASHTHTHTHRHTHTRHKSFVPMIDDACVSPKALQVSEVELNINSLGVNSSAFVAVGCPPASTPKYSPFNSQPKPLLG